MFKYSTGGKGSILHLKQDDNMLHIEKQKDTIWHFTIYFKHLILIFFFMHIFSGLIIDFYF